MASELSAHRSLHISSAEVTDIGDRSSNQDAQNSVQLDGLACFVVSDGAGGHAGGEVASSIVVKAVIDSFLQELSFGARALQFYVEHAIARVAQAKIAEEPLNDMSATVAILLIDMENRQALWAHLGDTRVYQFRDGRVCRITRDHSLVQQFVDAGYCPAEALRTHPQRSVLYAAVGTEGDTHPEVTQEAVELHGGDACLLCTDGFWERITESEMEQSLMAASSVHDWLQQMCEIIERNGGNSLKSRDNSTAQALWFTDLNPTTI
jgi:serine/threonine protein phosphatase PrpC